MRNEVDSKSVQAEGEVMKVLMVSTFPPSRCGVAYYTRDLITALRKLGIKVDVLSDKEWKRNDPLLPLRVLRCISYDVIHFQHEYLLYGHPYFMPVFLLTLFLTRIMRAFRGKPEGIVVTQHSTLSPDEMTLELWRRHRCWTILHRFQKLLAVASMRLLGICSDKIIVHSSHSRNILISKYCYDKSKVRVIPHGLWSRGSINSNSLGNPIRLLIFGFLRPTKDYETALKALKHLPDNFHLYIAGGLHKSMGDVGSRCLGKIERLVDDLGIQRRVHFELGFVDKDKVFNNSDIVLLPYTELYGGSGALCDAVSFLKPVIATDLPHFVSILKGYKWFMRVGDPYSLAKNLLDLTGSVEAWSFVARYRLIWSWINVAKPTIRLYEELVTRNSRSLQAFSQR